jgi:transcriptional regulator with GAF, ATPase, and Fis domain/CHASE2 domain-containing sensor protein
MTKLPSLTSLLLLIACAALLSLLLRPIDTQLQTTRYQLRGELSADTNIVIVYLDNDDIRMLGGWPLQRNYYALMLDKLREWGAKVIVLDILFDSPSLYAPEYDQLLADMSARCSTLVMVSYGRAAQDVPGSIHIPAEFFYPNIPAPDTAEVLDIVAPYDDLLRNSTGLGHSNVDDNTGELVPAFIYSPGGAIPAVAIEAVRDFYNISREDVRLIQHRVHMSRNDSEKLKLKLDVNDNLHINHIGRLGAFQSIRFPLLLKEYRGRSIDIPDISGKIVLVGIVAEGRSGFVASPFTPNLPSLAHHATIIDNILRNRLLRYPSYWMVFILTTALAIFGYYTVQLLPGAKGLLTSLAVFVLYIAFSIYIFSSLHYVLPILAPVTGLLLGALIMFVLYIQVMKTQLDTLEKEKAQTLQQLEEKEERLKKILEELDIARRLRDTVAERKLEQQLFAYEAEIRGLQLQMDDTETDESGTERQSEEFEGIQYCSNRGPMRAIVSLLQKVAPTDTPVLLLGESGTGKELAARAIHNRSPRKTKAFIAVNCGALSETLLESELFGHEKGAFTGAIAAKPGRFELADGGTILLDEIAETSEAFQVKLLRVLQEGTFERVGGTTTLNVNVRIIAATNKNVADLIGKKKFREDLYYRLNVFTITLPPLRERQSDIPLLIAKFLKSHSPELKLSRLSMEALRTYGWPGNVRELQGVIQRAVLLALSENRAIIRLSDMPPDIARIQNSAIDLVDRILDEIRHRGFSRNAVSQTAKELGDLNRGTVAEYLRGYSLQIFVNEGFDFDRASRIIAGVEDPKVQDKAKKKLYEYLTNIARSIDRSAQLEDLGTILKGKYKNLPQRYHQALDDVIEAYHSGKWDIPRRN